MKASRAPKQSVREYWISYLEKLLPDWDRSERLYTTLCGAEAMDVKLLLSSSSLEPTEVGGISAADAALITAVESDSNAVAQILREVPGLSVLRTRIEDLIGGATNPITFGERKNRATLFARVLNLDYNGPFALEYDQGFRHPQIEIIRKIAQARRMPDLNVRWTVFLTFQGEVTWDVSTQHRALNYLQRNAVEVDAFRAGVESALEERTSALILEHDERGVDNLANADRTVQQEIVASVVAKRVTQLVSAHGWRTQTLANWHYGGESGAAPMCTWAFEFEWDDRADEQPHAVYHEALASVFENFGEIHPDGSISYRGSSLDSGQTSPTGTFSPPIAAHAVAER